MKSTHAIISSFLLAGVLAASASLAQADEVSPSYKTSPEIYKIIAENDEMVVILATWPAGMKDKLHSHPKSHATYSLTDCNRRLTKSDGTSDEKLLKAGSARIAPPIKAHTFENLGKNECQAILVELK